MSQEVTIKRSQVGPLLIAFFMPGIGFLVGFFQLATGNNKGFETMVASLMASFFWVVLIMGLAGSV